MTARDDVPVRFWGARQACEAISTRKISCSEYVGELLTAHRENRDLNAFISLNEERAAAAAAALDGQSGTGILHGLPIAVKDAIAAAGLPATAGTEALRGYLPEKDADVVEPLVAAGAFVLGKLNMHELSYGITSNNGAFGPVRNPYDLERIPGGSSGGAGAAVAAGLVPAALGTDTGGSVRIPAALCGVVGFRPTTGRYSQKGIVPVSHTRDTAGPLCRSVSDAAMIDAAITGEPDQLESVSPGEIRLGLPNHHFLDNLAPETAEVFEARIDDLRTAGCEVIDVDISGIEPPTEACGFPIAMYETKGDLESFLAGIGNGAPTLDQLVEGIKSPDVKGIMGGTLAPEFEQMAGVYQDAMENRRPRLQGIFASCFADNGLDALIFPTTPLPACKIGEDETTVLNGEQVPTFPAFIHNTDADSTAGIPGISIPGGLTPGGLPVGLEIDGPEGGDRRLLAIARMIEDVFPLAPRPPNRKTT